MLVVQVELHCCGFRPSCIPFQCDDDDDDDDGEEENRLLLAEDVVGFGFRLQGMTEVVQINKSWHLLLLLLLLPTVLHCVGLCALLLVQMQTPFLP